MLTRSAASSHHLWRCGHLASWPAAARHLCKLRQLRGTKTAIINIWIFTLSTLSSDCVAEDAARHVCHPSPSHHQQQQILSFLSPVSFRQRSSCGPPTTAGNEGFTITEKAPTTTRAFSWLKVPTIVLSHLRQTLLRH